MEKRGMLPKPRPTLVSGDAAARPVIRAVKPSTPPPPPSPPRRKMSSGFGPVSSEAPTQSLRAPEVDPGRVTSGSYLSGIDAPTMRGAASPPARLESPVFLDDPTKARHVEERLHAPNRYEPNRYEPARYEEAVRKANLPSLELEDASDGVETRTAAYDYPPRPRDASGPRVVAAPASSARPVAAAPAMAMPHVGQTQPPAPHPVPMASVATVGPRGQQTAYVASPPPPHVAAVPSASVAPSVALPPNAHSAPAMVGMMAPPMTPRSMIPTTPPRNVNRVGWFVAGATFGLCAAMFAAALVARLSMREEALFTEAPAASEAPAAAIPPVQAVPTVMAAAVVPPPVMVQPPAEALPVAQPIGQPVAVQAVSPAMPASPPPQAVVAQPFPVAQAPQPLSAPLSVAPQPVAVAPAAMAPTAPAAAPRPAAAAPSQPAHTAVVAAAPAAPPRVTRRTHRAAPPSSKRGAGEDQFDEPLASPTRAEARPRTESAPRSEPPPRNEPAPRAEAARPAPAPKSEASAKDLLSDALSP